MIIRTARPDDLSALLKLSAMLPAGMTSMPVDQSTWEKKLKLTVESFASTPSQATESVYLLVMEEPVSGRIVGTAGIHAGVGLTRPFYNYKLSKHVKASQELDIRVTSNVLNLVNDFTGETELTSLFVMPDFRKNFVGQFLSRSRYLFMSDFPERFSDIVFAEIRGWLDINENSPFWQHLGKKFFNLPFEKADFISAVNGSQFISDLMPRFPVYLELLAEDAVEVIGKPHKDSAPAKRLLEKEGFKYQGTIDIFDAGPVMECERDNIASIKETTTGIIGSFNTNLPQWNEQPLCILSNRTLPEYRLVLGKVTRMDNGELSISADDAKALGVERGSEVSLLQIR